MKITYTTEPDAARRRCAGISCTHLSPRWNLNGAEIVLLVITTLGTVAGVLIPGEERIASVSGGEAVRRTRAPRTRMRPQRSRAASRTWRPVPRRCACLE